MVKYANILLIALVYYNTLKLTFSNQCFPIFKFEFDFCPDLQLKLFDFLFIKRKLSF